MTAALVAAGAASGPAAAATPHGFFGVMADGPLLSGAVALEPQVASMAAAHVGAIRMAVYWSDAQPLAPGTAIAPDQAARFRDQGGVPTDLTTVDAAVLAAARRGIDVLPTVLRAPPWAREDPAKAGSPPRDPATYARFLLVLVGRYGPHGSLWTENPEAPPRPIRRWQVWNEPELVKYFTPAERPAAWPAAYVRLLRPAAAAIHVADPGAEVVAAGLTGRTWIDLGRLYRAGARAWFDVAAIHPFSRRVANVLKIVRLTRATMRRAGDGRTPLLLSEVSWSSGRGHSTLNYGWETSERGQAAQLRAALAALARRRIADRLAGVFWYTWLSPPIGSAESFDYAGLRRLTAGGRVVDKPALAAFRAIVGRLTER